MSDTILVAIATGLVNAGILVSSVWWLSKRQDEQFRQLKGDLNGLGKKERSLQAETIILSREHADFAVIVRKLINGI
jgi:hypothetical protein